MVMEEVKTTIYIRKDFLKKIKEEAKDQERTMQKQVSFIIKEYFKNK